MKPDRWTRIDWGARKLARDEERALVLAAQAGDEGAMDTLARCNLAWVRDYSSLLAAAYGVDGDDAFGAAQFGLLEAIGKFDVERGVKLVTYLSWYIRMHIQKRVCRYRGPTAMPGYLLQGLGSDENRALSAAAASSVSVRDDDATASPPPHEAREETKARSAAVAKALRVLTGRERLFIRLAYGLDGVDYMTNDDVARELGVSKQRVSAVRQLAEAKLRETISTYYLDAIA